MEKKSLKISENEMKLQKNLIFKFSHAKIRIWISNQTYPKANIKSFQQMCAKIGNTLQWFVKLHPKVLTNCFYPKHYNRKLIGESI